MSALFDLEHFAHGEISPRCPHPVAHPHSHEETRMSSTPPAAPAPVFPEPASSSVPVAPTPVSTVALLERSLADAEAATARARAWLTESLSVIEELQADVRRAEEYEDAVRALLLAERTHRGQASKFSKWLRQVAGGVDPVLAARTLQGDAS